jgi:hypothetical protein
MPWYSDGREAEPKKSHEISGFVKRVQAVHVLYIFGSRGVVEWSQQTRVIFNDTAEIV